MFGTRLLIRAFFLLRLTHAIQAALTAAAVSDASGRSTPGITAVLLNWARLRNNIDIVNTLCSSDIEDIVQRVVVWNNNPRIVLKHDHFAQSACSSRRLKIINSPQNVYFQARFLACAAASTEYCFIQDDDYLVLPDTIRALHTHLSMFPNLTATHLLPPHEHLATTLRTAVSADHSIHTGFAWLGHGAMLRRSAAVAFLQLLGELSLSDLEMKMADNYYTILSNSYPDIWMDDGIPLDGVGAFTVGTVGDERNWDHMSRALRYLERRLALRRRGEPYVRNGPYHQSPPFYDATAVCIGDHCTLRSNIHRLPEFPVSSVPLRMRDHEAARRVLLGNDLEQAMLQHPLSYAVDFSNDTAFRGVAAARAGDFLTMDRLSPMRSASELVFITDAPTGHILGHTVFELSQDAASWVPVRVQLSCSPMSGDHRPWDASRTACTQPIPETHWRFVRALLPHDMQQRWVIFDMRLRHGSANTNSSKREA